MSKSRFNEPYKRVFDNADPVLAECKRKVPYPTRDKAESVLRANRLRGDLNDGKEMEVYPCLICGKFHIGHTIHNPVKLAQLEVIRKNNTASTILPQFSTKPILDQIGPSSMKLALLADPFKNFYVFELPEGMPHTEGNILDHGVLIAMKRGSDGYKNADGTASAEWKEYFAMSPIYLRMGVVDFQKKIQRHLDEFEERGQLAKAGPLKNPVLKGGLLADLVIEKSEEKSAAAASMQKVAGKKGLPLPGVLEDRGEMFNERKVWRDPSDNKPYVKSSCKCVDCNSTINFRAKVTTSPTGAFGCVMKKKPVGDSDAVPTGPLARTWRCGECVRKAAGAVPPIEKPSRRYIVDKKIVHVPAPPASAAPPAAVAAKAPAAVAAVGKHVPVVQVITSRLSSRESAFFKGVERMMLDYTVKDDAARGIAFMAAKAIRLSLTAGG